MKTETSGNLRSFWDDLSKFHCISTITATIFWWIFMRLDEAFVGMALREGNGANVGFILVSAGLLHLYFKATTRLNSREGRIIAALFGPIIGVSIFCALATPVAMAVDPANAGEIVVVGFLATFLSPLFLFASWKAMVFPMLLTCWLAEHIAKLGNQQFKAELRKKLASPAAAYLYTRTGRL